MFEIFNFFAIRIIIIHFTLIALSKDLNNSYACYTLWIYEACIYGIEVDVLLIIFQDFRYIALNNDIFLVVYIYRSFFLICMLFWYVG